MNWTPAQRAHKMNSSVIRDFLKITDKPGMISFAGGLPSPSTFPVDAFATACATVLKDDGRAALQYAASEGYTPLREYVAASLPWAVDPSQVLITTGSQQALDLIAKILIDRGSRVLVEAPTYLGALLAFTPMEPDFVSVATDDQGIDVSDLTRKFAPTLATACAALPPEGPRSSSGGRAPNPAGARFFYVIPNFQNPTGRSMTEARRAALSAEAARLGLPLIEDNPYGDLWFDTPPPLPLSARNPDGCMYLGSFSKTLAPGLRLGFVVAPKAIYPKLLQAKQAADLHTPSFNQRIAYEVLKGGFLDQHVPTIRALYRSQRDAMLAALDTHLAGSGVTWNTPAGGMFLWLRLPEGMNAGELLPQAVASGVAYVPGAAFYSGMAEHNTLRLSFVTASVDQIHTGVAALAAVLKTHIPTHPVRLAA